MDERAISDERTRTFIRRGARWAALFEVAGILMLIGFLVSAIRIGGDNDSTGSVPLVGGALVLGVFLGLIAGPVLINRWGTIRAVATHASWRQLEATTWGTSNGRVLFQFVDEHGVARIMRSGGLIPQAQARLQTGPFSFAEQPQKQRAIMTAHDLRTIVLLKPPLGPQQEARWRRTKPQVTAR